MIGKKEWFARRRYGGWGLSPRTWQGGVYVMVIAAVAAAIQTLQLDENIKLVLTIVWIALVIADVLEIMMSIKLDEREKQIEALADRNACWAMLVANVLTLIYVVTLGRNLSGYQLMPVIITPILIGTIAKGITNYVIDKKGI